MAALKIKIDIMPKLLGLPKAAKQAIAVTPTIIMVAVVVFMAILPKGQAIDKLKEEIAVQEQDISKKQSMAAQLEELKVKNAQLQQNLLILKEALPEEGEISSLLKQISDLAVEANLKIGSWTPSPRQKHSSGIVYAVPVALRFTGAYHELGKFFASLTQLDRIVNVEDISLVGPKLEGNKVILSITFTAVTFTAVEGIASDK